MDGNTVTFGIEIESGIPVAYGADFPAGSPHHGIQLIGMPTGWTGQRDGSIEDLNYRTHLGVELVSPVLRGEQGLVEVCYLCDYMASVDAIHNRSMGLHVHVGAKDFPQNRLNALMDALRYYERAFFGLNGDTARNRWANTFCSKSDSWYHNARQYGTGIGNPNNETYPHNRYRSLNLTNYNPGRRKNTIEFRMFSGTHNPAMVITAVYMAVGLVTAVCNGMDVPQDRQILSATTAARTLNRDVWGINGGNLINRVIRDVDNSDQTRELFRNCRESGL